LISIFIGQVLFPCHATLKLMMDTLAALHHATVCETLEISLFRRNNLVLPAIHRLLCLGLGLATWGIAGQALSLQLGDSGDEVADLQSRLATLGYLQIPVTGFYGDITADAVIRFQNDNQLLVDGIAERETLAVLREREKLADSTIGKSQMGQSTVNISPTIDVSFTNQNQAIAQNNTLKVSKSKIGASETIISQLLNLAAGD
jgi:Putative peptidoglycan binding domain